MGADAKDYDNDGAWISSITTLMGQIWALFHNQRGKYFRYVSPPSKALATERSLFRLERRIHRLQQRRLERSFSANGDVDNLVPNAPQHDTLFENRDGKEFVDVHAEMGADFIGSGFNEVQRLRI